MPFRGTDCLALSQAPKPRRMRYRRPFLPNPWRSTSSRRSESFALKTNKRPLNRATAIDREPKCLAYSRQTRSMPVGRRPLQTRQIRRDTSSRNSRWLADVTVTRLVPYGTAWPSPMKVNAIDDRMLTNRCKSDSGAVDTYRMSLLRIGKVCAAKSVAGLRRSTR